MIYIKRCLDLVNLETSSVRYPATIRRIVDVAVKWISPLYKAIVEKEFWILFFYTKEKFPQIFPLNSIFIQDKQLFYNNGLLKFEN